MQRFFVAPSHIKNKTAEVSGSDARQIKTVLRRKTGDELIVCDGISRSYLGKISGFKDDLVLIDIIREQKENTEPQVKITLAQSLPKASKMDFIIQKSIELGAYEIIPLLSERSIPKIAGKESAKIKRWQKISKEAAEQSGRGIIPQIRSIQTFNEVLRMKSNYDLSLIPWELEKATSLRSVLKNKAPSNILVVIGPEGGFSQSEVDSAKKAGFLSVSLGKRILRTETAPLAILANLLYELEQ